MLNYSFIFTLVFAVALVIGLLAGVICAGVGEAWHEWATSTNTRHA